MNLKQVIGAIFELYGHRNAMFARGDMRAMWLHERIDSFWKKIRKGVDDKQILANTLGSLFARLAAFADSFVDLPLVEAMCEKYPWYGCAYCGCKPCQCEIGKRKDVELAEISALQMEWTISKWIEHVDAVYGINNRKRGIYYLTLRLIEEIHEAEKAHHFDDMEVNILLSERRVKIAREFADALTWVFSLAAVLEIDLETAIIERYTGVCNRCQKRPCDCGSPFIYVKRANPVDSAHTVPAESD